jgi:outer membrane lipoprotein SlyB
MSSRLRRFVAVLTASAMLAACTTRDARIGANDGSDVCRAQVVALDSTGNFFGESIVRGAAVGAVGGAILGGLIAAATGRRGSDISAGAAIGAVAGGLTGGATGYFQARQQQAADQAALNQSIASDLAAENAQLDRTQIAFDQLMDCRFGTAQRIREDVRAGRLARPQGEAAMADVRALTQRDIQLAQTINGRIAERGAQFDTAIENVAPGVKEQAQAGARVGRVVPVQARATVPLRLRPDPASPEIGRVAASERVTLAPATGGFAQVETAAGVRGYAPTGAFPEARNLGSRPAIPAAGTEGDVRSLAASNIARRDNFAETVGNAERLAQGQGFELAG